MLDIKDTAPLALDNDRYRDVHPRPAPRPARTDQNLRPKPDLRKGIYPTRVRSVGFIAGGPRRNPQAPPHTSLITSSACPKALSFSWRRRAVVLPSLHTVWSATKTAVEYAGFSAVNATKTAVDVDHP